MQISLLCSSDVVPMYLLYLIKNLSRKNDIKNDDEVLVYNDLNLNTAVGIFFLKKNS